MGIRFTTNTWRAPLQLIDCWLPANHPRTQIQAQTAPRILQRFARAGWLNRTQVAKSASGVSQKGPETATSERNVEGHRPVTSPPNHRVATSVHRRPDARLVISGRIGDVCAELERLAALEHRAFQ